MNRFLVFVFAFCQGFCALGATTWDGDGDGTSWCDEDNWSGDSLPDAGDDVTIGSTFTVVISGTCNALSKKLKIEGSLTIDSGGSLITAGDVELTANNTAVFENNGTVNITGKLKAEPGSGTLGDGPSVINASTITISGEFNIGNGDGAGELTNSGFISADKAHIDGNLCNSGSIDITTEFKNHGGVVTCGGIISTPLVVLQKNGSRAGTFTSQRIVDDDCSAGDNSTGPSFEIKDGYGPVPFDDFVDNATPTDVWDIDPDGVYVCNENANEVLPVELLYFTGASNKESVDLSWSTATEINNDHFEIESSLGGLTFSKIGQVTGHGSTNESMKYSFVDESPSGFENYYRLKQVDYDGQFEYFNTIMVLNAGSSGIKIYPNPTSANSTIIVQVNNSLEQELVSVELTDISGRILQEKLGYDNSFEISTAHLTKGTFLVRVSVNSIVRVSKVLVD